MSRAILWFRRDLRLDDNPALEAAMAHGAVLPVYIHAPQEEAPWAPGAASLAWLRESLASLDAELRARGAGLWLRSGPSLEALRLLANEVGADAVFWNRGYEPAGIERDRRIKRALHEQGIRVETHNAALLAEPWQVQTGSGGPYRVFTPFWRTLKERLETLPAPSLAPASIRCPAPPDPIDLELLLPVSGPGWERKIWDYWQPGESGASAQLDEFIESAAARYTSERDLPDRAGTSRLSPHLHFGEISPRRILAGIRDTDWPASAGDGVEGFVRQLGWRDFSHHLLYHFPHTTDADLNPRFESFPWNDADQGRGALQAWQSGRTGVPLVDAGMRELWQTGWMHNRVRMVVASFLTKNLRQHWRHGARWFWDTLVDADLANNTQGWQWSAGTGADAAPYFRIFNPVTQAKRFDPEGRYLRRWLPELSNLPDAALFAPWKHPALLARDAPGYPARPIVDPGASRKAALAAYRDSRPEKRERPR